MFHCPYCHGYELDQGQIGVLATSAMSMHHGLMLPDWGNVTLFLNGAFVPTGEQGAALARRGVTIEATPVARIDGAADVVLDDGRCLPMAGLFVMARTSVHSPLAEQLGCALTAGPLGDFVQTDLQQASNIAGVFCCGDMARAAGSVALAVADGAMAGVAAHRSLIAELQHAA